VEKPSPPTSQPCRIAGRSWKTTEFDDFLTALAFTNRAGGVAEAEGHHPEITLTWGKATVSIWTHSIDGLSENDFILAARLDTLA